jgi:predicted GIY-YIG superfamily endonuclease
MLLRRLPAEVACLSAEVTGVKRRRLTKEEGEGGYVGGLSLGSWLFNLSLVCNFINNTIFAGKPMKHVYLLQSISHPEQRYVGLTSDLDKRLAAHNAGQSPHTAKFTPWKIITSISFTDHDKAAAFEQYLKSGSGRAFASKRFW